MSFVLTNPTMGRSVLDYEKFFTTIVGPSLKWPPRLRSLVFRKSTLSDKQLEEVLIFLVGNHVSTTVVFRWFVLKYKIPVRRIVVVWNRIRNKLHRFKHVLLGRFEYLDYASRSGVQPEDTGLGIEPDFYDDEYYGSNLIIDDEEAGANVKTPNSVDYRTPRTPRSMGTDPAFIAGRQIALSNQRRRAAAGLVAVTPVVGQVVGRTILPVPAARRNLGFGVPSTIVPVAQFVAPALPVIVDDEDEEINAAVLHYDAESEAEDAGGNLPPVSRRAFLAGDIRDFLPDTGRPIQHHATVVAGQALGTSRRMAASKAARDAVRAEEEARRAARRLLPALTPRPDRMSVVDPPVPLPLGGSRSVGSVPANRALAFPPVKRGNNRARRPRDPVQYAIDKAARRAKYGDRYTKLVSGDEARRVFKRKLEQREKHIPKWTEREDRFWRRKIGEANKRRFGESKDLIHPQEFIDAQRWDKRRQYLDATGNVLPDYRSPRSDSSDSWMTKYKTSLISGIDLPSVPRPPPPVIPYVHPRDILFEYKRIAEDVGMRLGEVVKEDVRDLWHSNFMDQSTDDFFDPFEESAPSNLYLPRWVSEPSRYSQLDIKKYALDTLDGPRSPSSSVKSAPVRISVTKLADRLDLSPSQIRHTDVLRRWITRAVLFDKPMNDQQYYEIVISLNHDPRLRRLLAVDLAKYTEKFNSVRYPDDFARFEAIATNPGAFQPVGVHTTPPLLRVDFDPAFIADHQIDLSADDIVDVSGVGHSSDVSEYDGSPDYSADQSLMSTDSGDYYSVDHILDNVEGIDNLETISTSDINYLGLTSADIPSRDGGVIPYLSSDITAYDTSLASAESEGVSATGIAGIDSDVYVASSSGSDKKPKATPSGDKRVSFDRAYSDSMKKIENTTPRFLSSVAKSPLKAPPSSSSSNYATPSYARTDDRQTESTADMIERLQETHKELGLWNTEFDKLFPPQPTTDLLGVPDDTTAEPTSIFDTGSRAITDSQLRDYLSQVREFEPTESLDDIRSRLSLGRQFDRHDGQVDWTERLRPRGPAGRVFRRPIADDLFRRPSMPRDLATDIESRRDSVLEDVDNPIWDSLMPPELDPMTPSEAPLLYAERSQNAERRRIIRGSERYIGTRRPPSDAQLAASAVREWLDKDKDIGDPSNR